MDKISWKALEYEYIERTTDWFWGAALVALVGIFGSLYFGNYLLSILILVGAISIGIFAIRKPEDITYTLEDDGLLAGDTFYEFKTLESFWVIEKRNPKIIFISKKFFMPHIIIPIKEISPRDVRDFLSDRLLEIEHDEPFLHVLSERLGL